MNETQNQRPTALRFAGLCLFLFVLGLPFSLDPFLSVTVAVGATVAAAFLFLRYPLRAALPASLLFPLAAAIFASSVSFWVLSFAVPLCAVGIRDGIRRKESRLSIVFSLSLAITAVCLFSAFLFLSASAKEAGEADILVHLHTLIQNFTDETVAELQSAYQTIADIFSLYGVTYPVPESETLYAFVDGQIARFPGTFLVCVMALSLAATYLLQLAYLLAPGKEKYPRECREFNPGLVPAVLYLLSLAVAFFAGESTSVFSVACANLRTVLGPMLAFAAACFIFHFLYTVSRLSRKKTGLVLWCVLLSICILLYADYAVLLLAILESVVIIKSVVAAFQNKNE